MPANPMEYWGTRPAGTPGVEEMDVPPAEVGGPCAVAGHTWPRGHGGPCERCGKPSSLPTDGGMYCRHGVPRRGNFGGHSCRYSDARDALVRYAELAANADHPGALRPAPDAVLAIRRAEWDGSFHRHMARLTELARELTGPGLP